MFIRTSARSTNRKTKCFVSGWFLGKIEKNTITIPIIDQRSNVIYTIILMPNLICNLEWTLGICVGPSPISSFWVLALVQYISTFGNLWIWGDFKNVGSSPIYTSVGPRTDPRKSYHYKLTMEWKHFWNTGDFTWFFFIAYVCMTSRISSKLHISSPQIRTKRSKTIQIRSLSMCFKS